VIKKFLLLPASTKFELLFYPVLLIYRLPCAWIRSLWAARVLINGRWSRYMGFHPHNSINSLFYRTQWINLDRYGRSHRSPILGLGDYPLKNWFHLSLPASYVYANAGAVTTLSCTIVWICSHLLWLDTFSPWWVLLVSVFLLLSSTAYAMAFARQNYQMLGWMFLPSALYFTLQGELVVASFAWLATGLSGLTPAFFAVPIALTIALSQGNMLLSVVLTPLLIISVSRFLPLMHSSDPFKAVTQILKLIGFTQKGVRYNYGMKNFGLMNTYFTSLYVAMGFLISYAQGHIVVLPFLGALVYLFNQRFFRVADEQSLIVIAASLFAISAIQAEPNWLTLLATWLAFNPLGSFLSIQQLGKRGGDSSILINEPFDHTPLMVGVEYFLRAVQPGDKVYCAFDDPNGKYSNIFDGYRVIHELPLNIASQKSFHLFPDWWAVAQTNYIGAPQCWGRSVDDVVDNCRRWDANFSIIYKATGDQLDSEWNNHFTLVSEFDWGDYLHLLRGVDLWPCDQPTPKWFLLCWNKDSLIKED
jgi:hypothetical protein